MPEPEVVELLGAVPCADPVPPEALLVTQPYGLDEM